MEIKENDTGMFNTSFNSQQALTIDQLRRKAPAAFASRPHESLSSRYSYIPTEAVILGLMHNDFLPFDASQSVARDVKMQPYTKHMIRFRHKAKLEKKGDKAGEVIVINAHDGSSEFVLLEGIFVMICGNGLIVSEGEFELTRISHRRRDAVDRVIEGSIEIIDRTDRTLEKGKQWGQLMLTGGEQRMFADVAHELRFGPPVLDAETGQPIPHSIQPHQLLEARRYDDNGNSLWDTFNRIQENSVRGGIQGVSHTGRRTTTRQIGGISQNVQVNQGLWKLADTFATMKSAAA